MSTQSKKTVRRLAAALMILMMVITLWPSSFRVDAATQGAPDATAKINAESGAVLRKKASTKSKKVKLLKNDTTVTIQKEVFTKKKSTKASTRWYYVIAGKKKGYVRSDLIDSITYGTVQGKTTAALNYRKGASTKAAKVGTLDKGSTVSVVLNANLKGNGTQWYKIEQNGEYNFVSASYVKLTGAEATPTVAAAAPTPAAPVAAPANTTVVAAAAPQITTTVAALPEKPVINTSNVSYPTTIIEGMGFGLKGTVTCDRNIDSAVFGIIDAAGNWIYQETRTVNQPTFAIAKVDAAIKFGSLGVGEYTYRGDVYVEGKAYTCVSYRFTVKKGTGGERMTSTAIALAWPCGTAKGTYGKKPTDAYKVALDQVYPEHNKWGKGAKTGASCDVFVGTVCRFSGLDPEMPRTVKTIWKHLQSHPEKWVKVPYSYKESELRSGDIIIYQPTSGTKHVLIYLNIGGKGYCAEASYPSGYYGYINTKISKLFKSSNKKIFEVYRSVAE